MVGGGGRVVGDNEYLESKWQIIINQRTSGRSSGTKRRLGGWKGGLNARQTSTIDMGETRHGEREGARTLHRDISRVLDALSLSGPILGPPPRWRSETTPQLALVTRRLVASVAFSFTANAVSTDRHGSSSHACFTYTTFRRDPSKQTIRSFHLRRASTSP